MLFRSFYATPGLGLDEVRIAYVLKAEDLQASVKVLAAAIEAFRKQHEESSAAASPA